MIFYKVVTPPTNTRRLCALAGCVASLKLEIASPDFRYIAEDPEGTFETPRRILGMTSPDTRGDVWVLLNIHQTEERLVRTIFHETRHLRTFNDYLEGHASIPEEINEGMAEFFANSEAPRGDYHEIFARLCEDGADLALEKDQPKTAAALADMLTPYLPRTARALRTRADALVKINPELAKLDDGWIAPSVMEARNAQYARRLNAQLKRERFLQSVELGIERAREAAAKIAQAAKEAADPYFRIPILRRDPKSGKWIDTGERNVLPKN